MSTNPLGLLVMAYGTPRSLDEVEAYYTHIRRGKPPTQAQLDDLTNRYKAIGGVSPLTQITDAQAEGLARLLNHDEGRPVKLYQGLKHTYPYIPEAVQKMKEDGITEAVGIVLAPHYSTMSVASYQKAAQEAAEQNGGPHLWFVDQWHMNKKFLDVLANRVQEAVDQFADKDDVMVVFSAHSLPERILAVQDPYPVQLRESGEAVARKLGLKHYTFAWQSAGQTGEPWLGPDILEALRTLKDAGYTNIVSCSQGFVADHLEVIYDIDIEAQGVAKQLGMHLVRTRQMNDDAQFLEALHEVVRNREQQGDVRDHA